MFRSGTTLTQLGKLSEHTLVQHLGIEFTDMDERTITATMPVDHRTCQPMGLLHGGASVALAETLGSVAAHCTIDPAKQYCVGIEVNANHVKGVTSGHVKGVVAPLHVGRKTHVWEIKIYNEADQLACISRITIAIIDK